MANNGGEEEQDSGSLGRESHFYCLICVVMFVYTSNYALCEGFGFGVRDDCV